MNQMITKILGASEEGKKYADVMNLTYREVKDTSKVFTSMFFELREQEVNKMMAQQQEEMAKWQQKAQGSQARIKSEQESNKALQALVTAEKQKRCTA